MAACTCGRPIQMGQVCLIQGILRGDTRFRVPMIRTCNDADCVEAAREATEEMVFDDFPGIHDVSRSEWVQLPVAEAEAHWAELVAELERRPGKRGEVSQITVFG